MGQMKKSTERRDRGDSARLSWVSCGSGWSVPCVSIQLTLTQIKKKGVNKRTLISLLTRGMEGVCILSGQ